MAQGLRFVHADNYQTAGKRTVYEVYSGNRPTFTESFNISFDLEIYDVQTIGNILRVKDKDGGDIYALAFSYDDEVQCYLKFNREGKESLITDTLHTSRLGPGRWIGVSIGFCPVMRSVRIDIDGNEYTGSGLNLPEVITPVIIFGTYPKEEFAAFSIRNLVISSGEYHREFPLNESSGSRVHDSHGKAIGRVKDGEWLINKSYRWEKTFSYISPTVAAIAYDRPADEFILLNADSVIRLRNNTGEYYSAGYLTGKPSEMRLGTNFIDPENRHIYTYEVNNLPGGEVTVSLYDIDSRKWTPLSTDYLITQRHLHSSYLDRKGGRYVIFGGFGNRQYSSEFVGLSLSDFMWRRIPMKGDPIMPRFSTSLGVADEDTVYIFGGTGNSSGDQTVGLVYYTDLYKVDLRSNTVEQLWSIDTGKELVPLRDIIVSEDGESFMAMLYPLLEPETEMQLYRFSIADGSYEPLADRVPIVSQSILTNANLYYNPERNRYYCVVQEFLDETVSEITVYSLHHPAVNQAALRAYHKGWGFYVCIAVLAISFCVCGLFFFNYRKKRTAENKIGTAGLPEWEEQTTANAVYLFGDFKVYNRSGQDITHLFSKKIRQMFVLILLSTIEEGGISSRRINECIWPDKDPASVKNIKGVAMSNLRKALEDMEGVSVTYGDGLFRIQTGPTFYCDYLQFNDSVKEYIQRRKESLTLTRLESFVRILLRGRFLMSFDLACFDRYKDSFEEKVMKITPVEMNRLYKEGRYDEVLRLATAVFTLDPLSEAAMWYEVNSLKKIKKNEQARERYYFFKITFTKSMGTEYKRSFEDVSTSDPGSFIG